jgi:hypothetical protein
MRADSGSHSSHKPIHQRTLSAPVTPADAVVSATNDD